MNEVDQLTGSWLAFRLGTARYALPLARVDEVVELAPLTRLPQTPEAMLGVLDLRGTPLMVLDLGRKLGAGGTASTRFSRVVVVAGPAGQLGLLVERLEGLVAAGSVPLLDLDEVLA
jgi:purine-binding chemotaxis protein CheW